MFCQLRKWSNIDYMDKDIWTFLSETRQPVVIYGTGDGADKLFSIRLPRLCEKQDLPRL